MEALQRLAGAPDALLGEREALEEGSGHLLGQPPQLRAAERAAAATTAFGRAPSGS